MIPLRTAVLSCGCEITGPDWTYDEEAHEMWLIDPLSEGKIIQWIEMECSDVNPFG
jgi:hypothetical protein